MQRVKNILACVLQVSVIVLILAFIVFGLAKIGLLETPPFLKQWFGDNALGKENENANSLTGLLKSYEDNGSYTVLKAEMTPESVRAMLSELTPVSDYVHDLEYTVYADGKGTARRLVLTYRDGLKLAYYVSQGLGAYKQVLEYNGTTTVSTYDGTEVRSVSYPTGDIDFAGQIGVIITHKDFLAASSDSGYTYSLLSGDEGTVMLITFTSQKDHYVQTQTYKLNLDYGIVTEANCYENGSLVYALTTNLLAENSMLNFNIPEGFEALLPDKPRAFRRGLSE